ncbi:acetylglucosaminyltransferase [Schizosaccharomyces cryophilus OY26]|uniref:Acetylglucosaminyltransferase n=1 Tax=Schizosaccharomyces cryophilus (strain OY26 / ATCC MYA-4695 / CBS 11777 / NBRC 106824 / NRRL Y48691) TaxID=653667 RepID=S9XJX5_SCHCR|nr:acetylglucosaminyltransferase [Schizosaccharomyces cryophilus OY26]EPY54001.1 acetylglucosaminyltransferase [Schizosaccharomyces cryophilus OY26]
MSIKIVINLGLLFVLHIYRNTVFPSSMVPSAAFEQGSNKHGPFYNGDSDDPSRYTYMGLLTLPTSDDDVYFNATRLLVYRLKHHPETKSQYPVHILVMKGVDEWKIDRLGKDGANIIMVDRVRTEDLVGEGESIVPGSNRYEYMFTKLSVFEQTQFDKVCILDSDLLIRKNIDDVFKTPYTYTSPAAPDMDRFPMFQKPGSDDDFQFVDEFEVYGASKQEFYPYLLAAADDRNPGHPTPPEPSETFNAGLMLVHPSKLHLHRIKMIARFPYMYENARMMEQSLLNLAYNTYGWFPWTRIDFSYNGVWITDEDLPYIRAAHGKFWEYDNQDFPSVLAAEWSQAFGEMTAFYNYEGGN